MKLMLAALNAGFPNNTLPAAIGTERLIVPPTVRLVKAAFSPGPLPQAEPVQLASVVFQLPVAAPLFQTSVCAGIRAAQPLDKMATKKARAAPRLYLAGWQFMAWKEYIIFQASVPQEPGLKGEHLIDSRR